MKMPTHFSGWIFILTVVMLVASIACFGSVYSWAWAGIGTIFVALTIIVLFRQQWRGHALVWNPILWPVLGFGLLVFWQWAAGHTAYRADTLTGLAQLSIAGCVLYLGLYCFEREKNLDQLATTVWVVTGILAIEAIVQYFTSNGLIYWFHQAAYASPVGPYVNRDDFAGCMEMLLPLSTVYAFRVRHSKRGQPPIGTWVARGIFPSLGIASIIMSQSRGGFLVLASEFALACILMVILRKHHRWKVKYMVFAAAALVALSALLGWQPLIDRIANLSDPTERFRLLVAMSSWHIFRDHMLSGAGFNSFRWIYPGYQSFDTGQIWYQAHDEYAQLLAETGLAGALAVLIFMGLFVRRYVLMIRNVRARHSAVRIAAATGCFGLMLHSWIDFQFHIPANTFLYFFLVGAMFASTHDRMGRTRSTRAVNGVGVKDEVWAVQPPGSAGI